MREETVAATLLRGVRGKGPFDFAGAANAISQLSKIGASLAERLAAAEINPLIVTPEGVTGVDVLFEPHSTRTC